MNKVIITVLGKDRPGIISQVSNILYELGCNLENVNQMILQSQFAGFFIVDPPPDKDLEMLSQTLIKKTTASGLSIHVDTIDGGKIGKEPLKGETFLITTIGPDQKGLVARFSSIIARHNVNIENLKAVFKGGRDPNANIMSYQVFITQDIDTAKLFEALRQTAEELDLDIRIQHKNIFNAINKI
ncbi:MAG: ACT domain-containing protein [Proteobacteria bacterium]|nr:ACT domain-containing protein [Pseudomonadota bacterium]MBU1584022.1 ACT domain-containing protein [Pseudomonadota bacterium]MBU2456144.1 ACT domain-containing protein [Pseudomonadota bacterium]MBU2630894.1 ACT domain-containing protein [Pseudomonadota bacterium]